MPAYYIPDKYLYVREIYANNSDDFKKNILKIIHQNYWRLDNQPHPKQKKIMLEMVNEELPDELLAILNTSEGIQLNKNGNLHEHSGKQGLLRLKKFCGKLKAANTCDEIVNLLADTYKGLGKNAVSTGFHGGSAFRETMRKILDETLCLVDVEQKEIPIRDVKKEYEKVTKEKMHYSHLLKPEKYRPIEAPIAYTMATTANSKKYYLDKNVIEEIEQEKKRVRQHMECLATIRALKS